MKNVDEGIVDTVKSTAGNMARGATDWALRKGIGTDDAGFAANQRYKDNLVDKAYKQKFTNNLNKSFQSALSAGNVAIDDTVTDLRKSASNANSNSTYDSAKRADIRNSPQTGEVPLKYGSRKSAPIKPNIFRKSADSKYGTMNSPTTAPGFADPSKYGSNANSSKSQSKSQYDRNYASTEQLAAQPTTHPNTELVNAVKAAKSKPGFQQTAQDKLTIKKGAEQGIHESKKKNKN